MAVNNTKYTYDKGGNLKTVSLNGDPYVNDIRYDAKGQRQSIRYENGTKTNYTYDPQNYRLRILSTIKLSDGTKMQDLRYFYDPVGNITWIKDGAQQNLFYANTIIPPDQKYTYDAIYRLIRAEGREQIHSNSFGAEDNWNDDGYCVALGADAARSYSQQYLYDAVGNIVQAPVPIPVYMHMVQAPTTGLPQPPLVPIRHMSTQITMRKATCGVCRT